VILELQGSGTGRSSGNFPHAWYVSIVQGKIYENWSPPQRLSAIRPGARAAVAFRIQRNGRTSRVSLREPSGYTLLDRSALEAVRTAGDFPPLPADYREEYLDVVVTFSPTLD
jgi:TonB family protein